MPSVLANGLQIEYETAGSPQDPALLLIMGLGAQLTLWPEGFCELLAQRGYHVVRFDNRDVGLSTKLDGAPVPDVVAAFARGIVAWAKQVCCRHSKLKLRGGAYVANSL